MGGKKVRIDRAKMRSPGRPPVLHRAQRRPFWQAIAKGRSSEEAAQIAGVSQAVGTRWFRECGGMPPSHLSPSSPLATGRYLSLAEREEIALLHVQGSGVREIGLHQQSHVSSGVTRPLGAGVSNIARPLRNGMPIARHDGPSVPSWRRTLLYSAMSKIAWLATLPHQRGRSSLGLT
jgi:hypothetical protein